MATPTPLPAGTDARGLEIRHTIDAGAMSRFQVLAVAVCVTLNMLDGFDVLVMAFTASEVAAAWQLTGAQLGALLSAGLVGMAAGSLFVAPWADRFGRRAVILFCLGLITLGMLLSAFAQGAKQLFVLRVLTGIGIGGMLASLNVITAEYSSAKWRSTAIGLQVTGYPIGATIGGTIAAFLITRYGWRSVFLFGALTSAVMIPVVLARLPESLDFLLARRPPNVLERLNDLLRRMNRPRVAALPETAPVDTQRTSNPVSELFAGAVRRSTLLICSSFFLLMFGFYFVMSWTPKLLVEAGLSTQEGITGGVLLNLGGILGGTLFAFLASHYALKRLTMLYLGVTAVFMVVFGIVTTALTPAFLLALAIGIFLFGSMVGLYALAPILYPAGIRSTGMGWAIGIGRIGAILAPFVAGLLLDAGWSTDHLFWAFAIPVLIAILTVRGLRAAT